MKQPKNVNERIDEMLMERGITKHELAAKIGKHVTTIDRILSGATTPSYGTTKVIAEALEVPIDYLIKGIGPKESEKKEDNNNPWKEEAYLEVKSKNALLEKELERLWQMIQHLTGGAKPNFRKALNLTDFVNPKALRVQA